MAGSGEVTVFATGAEALEEVIRRLDAARREVLIRAFLWRDDEAGNRVGEAVLRAAHRGVRVFIKKDLIAAAYEHSGGNKQSFFHKRLPPVRRFQAWFLEAVYSGAGVVPQRPNPLAEAILAEPNVTVEHERARFDHAKLFAFDDESLVLGSMGIGDDHCFEWVELMVGIDGHEHVDRLRRRLAGEVDFDPARRVDFLLHTRDAHAPRTCAMLEQRLAIIDGAQRSLTIQMAFLGDPRFTKALIRAVERGVDVLLHTAARADVLGDLGRATCDRLLRRTGAPPNLTIVLHPVMVHAKAVVADGEIADVGSANFTPLSHGVYDEINVYVRDAAFARRIEAAVRAQCEGGIVADRRVPYRKFHFQVERAIVAYQARKGGRLQ